jgi:hypothetical protein
VSVFVVVALGATVAGLWYYKKKQEQAEVCTKTDADDDDDGDGDDNDDDTDGGKITLLMSLGNESVLQRTLARTK